MFFVIVDFSLLLSTLSCSSAGFISPLAPLSQWVRKFAWPRGGRRNSNSGYRRRDVNDRILLFLYRMRRDVPFEGLGFQFGIGASTAKSYYDEMLGIFHASLVPLLLHPLRGDQIERMTPPDFARDLPGCKVIFDLTGLALKSKENVLLSRILYSAYHHRSEAGALFGNTVESFLEIGHHLTPSTRVHT